MAVNQVALGTADRPGLGIALLSGGIFIFSFQDIIVRTLSDSYPVLEFVFFRSIFSILPVLALVAIDGGLASLRVTRPGLHLLRGVLMLVGYTTYFLAVASAPLATVVALFFCTPLIVTALAAVMLRETIGLRRWTAVLIGFGGVLLVMQPGGGALDPGAYIAVLSAFVYAFCVIITRRLGSTDSGISMVATQTAVYLVLPGIAGLLMQDLAVEKDAHNAVRFLLSDWVMPDAHDLGLMAFAGIIAAVGFYGLTQAYRSAPPAVVTPFEYTGIVWGIVWGYTFWSEVPDLATWAGIAVIVASGVYVIHREAHRGQRIVAGRQLRPRT